MNDKILVVLVMALLPGVSIAQGPQNYQCSFGDLQRRVEVLYEAGGTVPCEVHYYKDTEAPGERQVLWRALNDASYCETKTREFIVKLQEMGWSCAQRSDAGQQDDSQEADDTGQDAEPVLGDDTDELLPGDGSESTVDP